MNELFKVANGIARAKTFVSSKWVTMAHEQNTLHKYSIHMECFIFHINMDNLFGPFCSLIALSSFC